MFAEFVVDYFHVMVIENDPVRTGDGAIGKQYFRFGLYLLSGCKPPTDDRIAKSAMHHLNNVRSFGFKQFAFGNHRVETMFQIGDGNDAAKNIVQQPTFVYLCAACAVDSEISAVSENVRNEK